MKFMNKIDKNVRKNDWDRAQLYEHGDVYVMDGSLYRSQVCTNLAQENI